MRIAFFIYKINHRSSTVEIRENSLKLPLVDNDKIA